MAKNVYFPFLDGLRAIAIIWVILHHVPASFPPFLSSFFERGDLGVEIFFAISGFVVIQSLESSKNLKEFYLKRIFRIFPGYYSVLLLILLLSLFVPSLLEKLEAVGSLLWSFPFFFYNYAASVTDNIPSSLNVFWSLCFEEQFYVFLGVLFLLAGTRKKAALLFFYVFVIVLRLAILSQGLLTEAFMLRIQTHLRLDAILIGCLLYEYQSYLLEKVKPSWFWVSLLVFTVLASLHSSVPLMAQGVLYIGLNVSLGGLILGMIKFPLPIKKILSTRVFTVIGVSSFEIYLLHEIVIGVLVKADLKDSPYGLLVLIVLLSIGAGILMHQLFTKPLNAKLRYLFLNSPAKNLP